MDEKEKSTIARQWETDKEISTRITARGRFEWSAWGKDIPHRQGIADTFEGIYTQIYDSLATFMPEPAKEQSMLPQEKESEQTFLPQERVEEICGFFAECDSYTFRVIELVCILPGISLKSLQRRIPGILASDIGWLIQQKVILNYYDGYILNKDMPLVMRGIVMALWPEQTEGWRLTHELEPELEKLSPEDQALAMRMERLEAERDEFEASLKTVADLLSAKRSSENVGKAIAFIRRKIEPREEREVNWEEATHNATYVNSDDPYDDPYAPYTGGQADSWTNED